MTINKNLIAHIAMEIANKHQLIINEMPKGNDRVLRHLAASSVHMAMFMKDFYCEIENKKDVLTEHEKEFLNKCGCDFNGKRQ